MGTDKISPDNWKELIHEKKVILYNTSVSSMLQGREKQIEKMKWVFHIFKEHPEVVLWWRPHPLELSTIQSMLPGLEGCYREVRKQYQEEKVGILDESTDLHRAIAISDAYYGDWSSVVQLYKAVKKPVFYENILKKNRESIKFLPDAPCVKNDIIWFMQLDSNKLIKMDRTTYEVEEIINIPYESAFQYRFYNHHIIDCGNKLLLLLEKSKNLYEYDIELHKFNTHPLGNGIFRLHSRLIIEKDEKILFFPYNSNIVWEYEIQSHAWCEKIHIGCQSVKVGECHEIIDGNLYMADNGSNIVYKYELEKNLCTEIKVGNDNSKYWGIKQLGEYFVLPHIDKKVITLWNENSGEVIDLVDFPKQYTYLNESAYLEMYENNGFMYIFPFYANMILKIDVQTKTITQGFAEIYFDADYDLYSENFSCPMYLCAKKYENSIYAYGLYKKCWQVFDVVLKKVQDSAVFEIKDPIHEKLLGTLFGGASDDEETFCENEGDVFCTLDNYIKNVSEHSFIKCDGQINRNSVGTEIHQMILRGN